ncbi:MAG: NAD(P)H-dependent oxidoreductase [Chitinophagaceae bacterium]|nr:NAD(P)H-dependent oxidoreductase [Chitinophagaceae bacterium]
MHWIGLSGSLRMGSYNTMLLNESLELLPDGVTMEIAGYSELPLYNGDLDLPATEKRPPAVQAFRDRLALADAFVIISPEYNYSIPGGLKNAIDWASRGEDSPLLRKPVALMGVTPGMWGTVRMQLAFHAVFQFLDMKPVYKPEVLINQAKTKFNEHGKLADEKTKEIIRKQLAALQQLVMKYK